MPWRCHQGFLVAWTPRRPWGTNWGSRNFPPYNGTGVWTLFITLFSSPPLLFHVYDHNAHTKWQNVIVQKVLLTVFWEFHCSGVPAQLPCVLLASNTSKQNSQEIVYQISLYSSFCHLVLEAEGIHDSKLSFYDTPAHPTFLPWNLSNASHSIPEWCVRIDVCNYFSPDGST